MIKRDDKGTHGIAVMRFLDAEFAARPEALTTWARDNGIDPAKFSKWRQGDADPDLAGLVSIADALGRPAWHLLAAAEYIDPAEFGAAPVPMTPAADVDFAIDNDPRLVAIEQELLRHAREMGKAAAAAGETRHVKRQNNSSRGRTK